MQEPRFSAVGKLGPYLVKRGSQYCVIVEGKPDREHREIVDTFTVSPDGRRCMYSLVSVSGGANHSQVVIDGQTGPTYDKVMYMLFSPDGKRTAYAAQAGGTFTAVVDGKVVSQNCDRLTPIRFSRDSAHFGYGISVRKGPHEEDCSIFMDGGLVAKHGIIGNPQFAAGGQFVWSGEVWEKAAGKDEDVLRFGVFRDNRLVYKSDQWMVKNFDFSDDGKHSVYEAVPLATRETARTRVPIVDGQAGPPVDEMLAPIFSSDGKHSALAARKGEKWFVVLDGKNRPECDSVSDLAFSPDGRHWTWNARSGGRIYWTLDGERIADYDQTSRPQFRADGAVEFLGVKSAVLYRVRQAGK
jgi:WD40 repeat protein